MSAYLKFFELEKSPFDTSARSSVVLGTKALRAAYAQIQAGLDEDAPRICVSGGTGMGKTSLARALPKLLGQQARVILLLNPSLPWSTLRTAIVKQLDLEGGVLSRKALLAAAASGRRLVIVVDQAEIVSQEALEHLDILLGYRSDEDTQLMHAVLLANLELANQTNDCPLLWWLDSLTTLQLEFAPIPAQGVESYINKHLKRAGWKGGHLFSSDSALAIHRLTGGVPGLVSQRCDEVLAAAAERGMRQITVDLVESICSREGPDRAEDLDQAEFIGGSPLIPGNAPPEPTAKPQPAAPAPPQSRVKPHDSSAFEEATETMELDPPATGREPSAGGETSAGGGPSAQREPSAGGEEPSALREPSAQRAPSAAPEALAGRPPSASRATSANAQPSTKQRPPADVVRPARAKPPAAAAKRPAPEDLSRKSEKPDRRGQTIPNVRLDSFFSSGDPFQDSSPLSADRSGDSNGAQDSKPGRRMPRAIAVAAGALLCIGGAAWLLGRTDTPGQPAAARRQGCTRSPGQAPDSGARAQRRRSHGQRAGSSRSRGGHRARRAARGRQGEPQGSGRRARVEARHRRADALDRGRRRERRRADRADRADTRR
jgi:type II secretory pathway predicted ATPase ExeA